MVDVAPSIAQAASTAFPPLLKMMAPAVAAMGLPVMATQFFPCRTGFSVLCAKSWVLSNKMQAAVVKFLDEIQSIHCLR
jgi:hypothetical protein